MRGLSDDAGVYVMSVAAELAGVHPQTLRTYERKGLVAPAGKRRYSQRDLARLRRIGALTAAGVNLEGVRRILSLEDALHAARADLERTKTEVADRTQAHHQPQVAIRPEVSPWPSPRPGNDTTRQHAHNRTRPRVP